MSNSFDPDQVLHYVGPDLGRKCLQRLSTDNTSRLQLLSVLRQPFCCRHVMIKGSPVSLTENSAVFRKTDFLKKSWIFKNPLIVLPFFLLNAISCDNLAEVAEKNQY